MKKVPLDRERESKQVGTAIQFMKTGNVEIPVYNTPISPYENFKLMLDGEEPLWMPGDKDIFTVIPRIIPDNVARAYVCDAEPLKPEENGGTDMFGIEWVYVPLVDGSMVKPGKPRVTDASDWEKVISFPNLDDYDWEGSSAKNRPLIDRTKMVEAWVMNGLFERLISFMDFEGAAMALLDEEQKDGVHSLFSKLCVFYDDLFGRLQKYYGVNMIQFHDDWGSQRAPFFSLATCREMVAPYLKRLVESCHKRGLYFRFHSCGKIEMLMPAIIEAGVDFWVPQPMNDVKALLDQYGDTVCLGTSPEIPQPDASKEEIVRIAREFVQKFSSTRRMYCLGGPASRTNPAYAEVLQEVYFLSREEYSK